MNTKELFKSHVKLYATLMSMKYNNANLQTYVSMSKSDNYTKYLKSLPRIDGDDKENVALIAYKMNNGSTFDESYDFIMEETNTNFMLFAAHLDTVQENCPTCDGDEMESCDSCDGNGVISCESCDGYGTQECKICQGEGEIDNDGESVECESCGGSGTEDCATCDGEASETCPICSGYGTVSCGGCNETGDGDTYIEFNVDAYISIDPKSNNLKGFDNYLEFITYVSSNRISYPFYKTFNVRMDSDSIDKPTENEMNDLVRSHGFKVGCHDDKCYKHIKSGYGLPTMLWDAENYFTKTIEI